MVDDRSYAPRLPAHVADSTDSAPSETLGPRRFGAGRYVVEVSIARDVVRTVWPERGDKHGPLAPMLVALTLVTGLVDAVSYIKLGHVFVANMTGNVVFLGFAIAGAHGLSVGASLTALAGGLLAVKVSPAASLALAVGLLAIVAICAQALARSRAVWTGVK